MRGGEKKEEKRKKKKKKYKPNSGHAIESPCKFYQKSDNIREEGGYQQGALFREREERERGEREMGGEREGRGRGENVLRQGRGEEREEEADLCESKGKYQNTNSFPISPTGRRKEKERRKIKNWKNSQ